MGWHRRRITRFCAWGGGKRWVQIGSPLDRQLTILRRLEAVQRRAADNMIALNLAFRDSFTPAIREMARAVDRLNRSIIRSRLWDRWQWSGWDPRP